MATEVQAQDTVLEVNELRCISARGGSSTADIPTLVSTLTPTTFSDVLVCLTELTMVILGGYYEVLALRTGKATPPTYPYIKNSYVDAWVIDNENRYLDKRHCHIPDVIDTSNCGSALFNHMYANPTRPEINIATQPTEGQKPALLDFVKNSVAKLHQNELITHVIDVKDMSFADVPFLRSLEAFKHKLYRFSQVSAAMPCHVLVVFRGHANQMDEVMAWMDDSDYFFQWCTDQTITKTRIEWSNTAIPSAVCLFDRFHYTFEEV